LIVADTSVVLALLSADDTDHERALAWYGRAPDTLVTTPLVIAELDYMLRSKAGEHATRTLYAQLESGALGVAWWHAALARTLEVVRRRPDVGLADASLVALAAHLGTARIATLDERDFRTLAPLTGEPSFTLLPADAD
jgi:uncharacterized protein